MYLRLALLSLLATITTTSAQDEDPYDPVPNPASDVSYTNIPIHVYHDTSCTGDGTLVSPSNSNVTACITFPNNEAFPAAGFPPSQASEVTSGLSYRSGFNLFTDNACTEGATFVKPTDKGSSGIQCITAQNSPGWGSWQVVDQHNKIRLRR